MAAISTKDNRLPLLPDYVLSGLVRGLIVHMRLDSDNQVQCNEHHILSTEDILEDLEEIYDNGTGDDGECQPSLSAYSDFHGDKSFKDIVRMFNVLFPGQTNIIVQNISRYNGDHRSHQDEPDDWEDPNPGFTWSKKCPQGVTLMDLLEGVYLTKGSKFDFWYELFGGLTTKIVNDTVYVTTKFDHGS
jgi:hypothetical protein